MNISIDPILYFQEKKPEAHRTVSNNIGKILIATCFLEFAKNKTKDVIIQFLFGSIRTIFNPRFLKQIEKCESKIEFERKILGYFSRIFPVEFFIYFETVHDKQNFATNTKNELKKYRKDKHKIAQIISSNFKKIKKFRSQIRLRKLKRSKLHTYRLRLVGLQKTRFVEKCKETKIFNNKNFEQIGDTVEFVLNAPILFLKSSKKLLKLLNYFLTILVKLH